MEEWDKNEEDIRKLMVEMTEMRDKPHSAEWKTLKARLAVAVWKHAEKLYKEVKVIKTNNDEKKEYRGVVSDCGVEIMEALEGVMRNFSPDKGDCIHYINRILKTLISKRKEKVKVEKSRNGVKLPEKKIKALKRLCESFEKNIRSPQVQEWLAKTQGCSLEDVRHLLQADIECRVLSENQDGTDEEEYSLLDFYAGTEPDNEVEMMEELHSIFSCIQQIWEDSQERTQDYLSALVTRQILSENRFISDAKLVPELRQYGFCDANILEQYLEDKLPLQEAVAEQFCRHKTDASRTMRHFQEKLTDLLKMKANLST